MVSVQDFFNMGTTPLPTRPVMAMGMQPNVMSPPSAFPSMPAMPISALQPPQGMSLPPVPAQRPDLSQVTTDQLSPFGHLGDTLNQLVVNKQQQQQSNGLIGQLLSQRFQPSDQDIGTSLMRTATENKYISPNEVVSDNIKLQLSPYSEMAKIQNAGVEANGGATGALVSRLMSENPSMFPSAADALYFLKGGANQGLTSSNGQITAMPGAPTAMGQVAYGKEAGKQGAELNYAAPIATAKTTASDTAKNTVQAQFDLPSVIANSNQSLVDIDNLMNDPGLDAVSGIRGMFPPIPGSAGAQTLARLKQVAGQTFLTAYNQLRGGGSITEVEGAKATAAKARLDQAQGKEAIQSALTELKNIIHTGVSVAQLRAGGNPGAAPDNLGMPTGDSTGGFDINSYLREKGLQ